MKLYSFSCPNCGTFDSPDKSTDSCPQCGKPVKRRYIVSFGKGTHPTKGR